MPRNIRMPDGTVIRGVPDGVSKDDFNAGLIKKFGQERYNSMIGKAAEKPAAPVDESAMDQKVDKFYRAEGVTRSNYQLTVDGKPFEYPRRVDPDKGSWVEQAARLRKSDAYQQANPDRMSPVDVHREVLKAADIARLDRDLAMTRIGPFDTPDFKALGSTPDQAAGIKMQEFVNSGDYTADELGLNENQFNFMLTPVDPPATAEEVQQDTDVRMYYAHYIHTPEEAAERFPEVHAREQAKIEANKFHPKAKSDPDMEARANNGWMAYWGTAVYERADNVIEGYKASAAAGRRQTSEQQMIGQIALRVAQRDYDELAPEAKRILDELAEDRGISVQDLSIRSLNTFITNAQAEGESLAQIMENIQLMEAAKPASADTTKMGHYADLLIQNSAQATYIMAGMALRNPMIVVAAMGTDIYGQEYGSRRLQGRTHDEAVQDAMVAVIIEGVTESIPVHRALRLMKQGERGKAIRLFEMAGTEFTQEVLAEAAMIGYDMGIIGEDMSMGEIFNRLTDAGVVGMAMGTVMTAPAIGTMDVELQNVHEDIKAAAKAIGDISRQIQGPAGMADLKKIGDAKQAYVDAIAKKKGIILERKKAVAEKKEAKVEKKEKKRKAKRTPVQVKREDAAQAAVEKDQAVEGEMTDELLREAQVLERASEGTLEEEDVDVVEELLDRGLMVLTRGQTLIVNEPGTRRLEALVAARDGTQAPPVEEQITPIPFESARKKAERAAIDEEIGRRMRGEQAITPTPYIRPETRREAIAERVDKKIKEPEARGKIADAIVKFDESEQAFHEREAQVQADIESQRDADYTAALEAQVEVELEIAANLAILDEKGVSGYKGTRLGDVLRNAMKTLEEAEVVALEALDEAFWNKPTQSTLFDIGGALAKGTKDYANLVRVGALKLAKHGLKYSAWAADMIGQFGESIKPVLARVYHDSKKKVQDVMKLSHEKFTTGKRKGQLKFAPKDYVKPGAIRRLRNELMKLAKEGAAGRFWYEKSGGAILKITGGNISEARQLAGLFAIYSSGTAVSANTTNALKMWAQFKHTGGKIKPRMQGTLAGRFSEQDRTAIAWLKSKESDENFVESFGNKRFPFYLNIMREVDPKNYEAGQGVTVDLWMMRAFGYEVEAPSDAQYAFVATEIKALADRLGWEKQQVQAAIWVAIKARWEFVQKQAKARAVEQGLAVMSVGSKGKPIFDVLGSTREEQIVNEKKIVTLFRDEALKVSVKDLGKKLKASKADFADHLANHYAVISWEAEPSTKLGSELNNLSLEDKLAMQAEIAEIFVNPESGREFLAEWLNILGNDQIVGPGAWEMNIGAVVQNSVIIPVQHKPGKTKAAQAQAKAAMNGYAAIMGYLLKQDAVAWHKPFYATTQKAANGVEIQVRGILSPEKTLKLYEAIYELTGNMDFAPIVLDGAVRVLNFSDMENRPFHKIIAAAADKAGVSGNIEVFQSDGDMITNDWRKNKKGQEYVEAINNSEDPAVAKAFARAKRKFAGDVAQVYAKYSGQKTDARIRGSRLDSGRKLRRKPKGHLRFRHFGKEQVGTISVEKAGTGIRGAERARTKNINKVISAYPNKGFTKEVGLGNFEYVIDVPAEQMYDANEDVMNLKDQAKTYSSFTINEDGTKTLLNPRLDWQKFEQLIKEAGFVGYYTPKAEGSLKGQARFFESIVIDDSAIVGAVKEKDAPQFSISSRARVTVVENELQEFEVREANGEIYYTEDADDAISTARSIYGADATVVIVDEFGDVITTDVAVTKPERIVLEKADPETKDQISEFLDEWLEETEQNPISSTGERIVNGTSAVELHPQGNVIWLDSIRSFDKGTGGGSAALKLIIELADLHGVTLSLMASPFEAGGNELSYADLSAWYQRNGFVGGPVTRSDNGQRSMSEMTRPQLQVLFHGTPHKFDKFSTEKIDMGEGYQAYGYGLYFAENSGVAGSYKNSLSGNTATLDGVATSTLGEQRNNPIYSHIDIYNHDGLSKSEIVDKLKKDWISDQQPNRRYFTDQQYSEAIESVESAKKIGIEDKGHLYEVDIPDSVTDRMLDWDAPLSEQSDTIRFEAFPEIYRDESVSGGEAYKMLSKSKMMGGDQQTSEYLNSIGIPGIKFYDGSSRSAQKGTRNIVLFNADDITQVKRDGKIVFEKKKASGSMTREPRNAKQPYVQLQASRGQAQEYGVPVGVVKAWIDEHFTPFYGLTNIEVVADVAELPDALYKQVMYFGYGSVVRGAFHEDPIKGPTIYIVANNAYIDDFTSKDYGKPDWAGIQETIMHESIGHFGLQALLGEKGYNRVMDTIIRDFPAEVKPHLRKGQRGPHAMRTAAEEVVAYTAGEVLDKNDLTKNQSRLWDRIVNVIKLRLAQMGLRKLTNDDIAQLVFRASHYVQKTPQGVIIKRARRVKAMRHAQRVLDSAVEVEVVEPQTSVKTSAFKRWFGKSKVVDEKGKPLVVYHGSVSDFSQFKEPDYKKHQPRTTGGDYLKGAFFFSDSAEIASNYSAAIRDSEIGKGGSNVMPVYLALKNPLIIDAGGRNWQNYLSEIRAAMGFVGIGKPRVTTEYDGAIIRNVEDNFSNRDADVTGNTYVAFKPEQIKSSIGNQGTFDPTSPNILLSIGLKKERAKDPDLDRFFRKIGHGHDSRLIQLGDWWAEIKNNWTRKLEIELLDQFAGIKHMEQELDILGDKSGYMSVRLTAGTDVVIRSAIERGAPVWDADGSVKTDQESDSLLDVLAPVSINPEMLKAFEAYIVAHRAKRLKKEDRERLFTRKEIGAALKFIRKKKLYGLFKKTAADLAAYKGKVLDFAQEAGVIDPVSRKIWENSDHVPFYRVLSEHKGGSFETGRFGARFGKVGTVVHRLRGGTDVLRDPLGSIVQNLSMLIEAAIKNRATADVVNNFKGTGVITKAPQAEITTALVPLAQIKEMLFEAGVGLDAVGQELLEGIQKLTALQPPSGENVIHVQEEGKRQYYFIHDQGVMRGLDNVTANQWNWLMTFLRMPKRLLTRSITLMPDFIMKNWFRDIWHSYILSRYGSVIPLIDSTRGWAKAIMEDETYQDILSGGGMFDAGYVNASDPKKTKIAIRKGLLGRGRHSILDTPRKLRKFYMRIANGAENAHRIIVYEKTLKMTGSRKQALFEARDLMDFSVRGANPIVRFLTETVPFWGARVQGLSRTGKGFTETPFTTFMRALPIVLASAALYAINRDDDRYKGLNDYEKRMYYHFYDVFEYGDHYRMPKPFEVGALFSTFPEIMMEHMLSQEPDRGKQAAAGYWWTIREMMMLAPDVQAINPFYELMINENRFTKAPIISEWEKNLDPKDRYSYRTNKTIKALVQKMPESAPEWMRSPKEVEHIVRGYLGSMMDYALAGSDMLFQKELNGGVASPTMRWDETPFFKSFKREELGKYDRYLNSMYSVLEEANKIHNSINKNKKLPQTPEVKARISQLMLDNEALLYARDPLYQASTDVKKVNKGIAEVYANTKLNPDQKRERLDKLLQRRSDIAKRVYDYRPGGKKNKKDGGGERESYWDLIKELVGKPKDEQVDKLIGAQLPHTATLINDITISDEKLRSIA